MKEDKSQKKNSALYCVVCSASTADLEKKNILSIRIKDPFSRENVTLCNLCLQGLVRQTYTEPEKGMNLHRKLRKIESPEPNCISITPRHLYNLINSYVIGQERAKRTLSLAVATHLRRQEDPSIEKSNILLMGPTGTGKTELARTIARILRVPFVVVDATVFTAHGYVGEDVEQIIYQLLQAAGGEVAAAEQGIVFIDEFDKLATTSEQSFVNTIAVQQALLKMMEGGKVKVFRNGNKKDSDDKYVMVNTSKILFICAGAFSGLQDIVRREKFNRPMGLGADAQAQNKPEDLFAHVTAQHLVKYGIIQEVLGRLPVITSTEALSETNLIEILTEPKNSLTRQYKNLLSTYGVTLEFTPGFLKSVAKEALSSGIGARGLRSVMEKRLEAALFDGPDLGGNKLIVAKANGLSFNPARKEATVDLPETKVTSLESFIAERRRQELNEDSEEVDEEG